MNRPAPWALTAGLIERRPFRVGGAMVDPVSRDAKWSGGEERLQPQTLKVLITLFSRRGEVVTRDELVQLCWDGRIVGDDVINRSISLVRHLAEKAGGFEIETVPRTGYRLVDGESSSPMPRRRWIAVAAGIVVCVAGLSTWALLGRQAPSQGVPPTPSISVAAFTAQANDPVAREVAHQAPISIEHMMAESGFATVRGDSPANSGGGPNDYVFSGDVRRSGTSVDATVQLVSRRDGTIAYTHDFSAPIDRAADLPDEIGAAIAAELAWTGAQMILDPHEHLSPEIESELMQALVLTIESHDSLRAYQMVRHAVGLAPNSAFAQLSLAVSTGFSIDSIPQAQRADAVAMARRASERAQAMAPEFGDVYIPWCLLHSPVRMAECDAHLRKAEAIDSSTSFAPGYLSSVLEGAGRIDESAQLAKVSLANDPYKPAKLARMIRLFEAAGRSDEAELVFQRAMRLWPDSGGRMRGSRLVGMAERGNYDGLAAFADPALDGPMIDPPAFAALLAAQRKHDLAGAQRACGMNGITDFTLTLCMTILADFGDRDRAFAIAATLYPASQAPPGTNPDQFWLDHPGGYETLFLAGPAARSMRTDPRFLAIAGKLGLLDYWRKDGLPDFCRPPQPEPVCAQLRRR
jgi:DNA-binding winged helix-turn-helix (wHTH) protein/tetratricopeptide (TPR) repeat protein